MNCCSDTWTLIRPYWFSEDRWAGRGLLLLVIGLNLGIVYINVLLNQWNNAFYNALQDKDYAVFWSQLVRFTWLAAFFIVAAVYQLYLNQMLQIRWRRWLTERYLGAWLADGAYYRMQLTAAETDNPDQRIAEDLRLFVGATLTLGIGGMRAVVTLVAFLGILWGLSGPLTVPLGAGWTIPGYMVWAALLYAIAGTWLTNLIGRPLVRPELRPAALRGRLPLRPRALPRERGGRRALPRRGRRAAQLPRALRRGGRATGGRSCAGRSGSPGSPPATARPRSSSRSWSPRPATSAARSRWAA